MGKKDDIESFPGLGGPRCGELLKVEATERYFPIPPYTKAGGAWCHKYALKKNSVGAWRFVYEGVVKI